MEDHPKQNSHRNLRRLIAPEEEILKAVLNHVALNDLEEARSIYYEAQRGNKVAQFIVAMSLLKAGREESAEVWFQSSAAQGFEPAKQHLKKAG